MDKEGAESGTPAAPSPLTTVEVPTSGVADNDQDDDIITTESSLASNTDPTSIKLPSDPSQLLEKEQQNTDPFTSSSSQ